MSAELRPRIKIISKLSKEEVLERLRMQLADKNNYFTGWAKEGYALISLPENDKRIWTPQLNIQIDEADEGSEIRGVIGPSASVWTAFAFSFSILGFIAFVALFWGLSRLSLDYSAEILWLVPIMLIIILGVYMLARIGQQMSMNQVKELKNFVESTLNVN
ncbi:MAG: hypothetical protein R3250_03655 [Melioribacteraceae bacterium]|nr:hypothetical protein [Melioribacteraceae bacterium]